MWKWQEQEATTSKLANEFPLLDLWQWSENQNAESTKLVTTTSPTTTTTTTTTITTPKKTTSKTFIQFQTIGEWKWRES